MQISPKTVFGPDIATKSNWLYEVMDAKVICWLDNKTRHFLFDYLAVRNSYQSFGITGLSDYSYLITPAFKALEGTLIQIGRELKFDLEKYNYKVGVVFSEENLEKYYNDVLDKIEDIDNENKLDIQQWLNNARRILRHLRHSPAHYNGEVKNNHNVAFLTADQILFTINEMCLSLLKSGLMKEPAKPIKPKAYVSL